MFSSLAAARPFPQLYTVAQATVAAGARTRADGLSLSTLSRPHALRSGRLTTQGPKVEAALGIHSNEARSVGILYTPPAHLRHEIVTF